MKSQQSANQTQKDSVWLARGERDARYLADLPVKDLSYEVMPSEEAVGRSMLGEITRAMDNGLSFVRDFERLLGEDFFRKVNSFTSMRTDAEDLESELAGYVRRLESLGGIDLFFLGLGPEAGGA